MLWTVAAAARREVLDQQITEPASSAADAARSLVGGAQNVSAAIQSPPSFAEIIQYTFFHRSATADPAQYAGQSPIGVVGGSLNARSGNAASLLYTLAQPPGRGTVELGDDGTYTYTPADALAVVGGSDSFRVTIDNSNGYRLTGFGGIIQGIAITIAQIFGLRQPDTVTVTVPVMIAHPDADGTLSQADLDRLVQVGAVGADVSNDGLFRAIVGAFTGSSVTDAEDALQVMNRVSGLLVGTSRNLTGDVSVRSTQSGGVTEGFYRLAQTVNGIPVLGSEVILTTKDGGTATGIFSGVDPAIYQVSTTPSSTIDEQSEVIAAARRILSSTVADPPSGFLDSLAFDEQLVIYGLDPAIPPALSWMVEVRTNPTTPTDAALESTTLFIAAADGNAGNLIATSDSFDEAASTTTVETQQVGLPHGLTTMRYDINVEREGTTVRLRYQLQGGRAITVHNGYAANFYLDLPSGDTFVRGQYGVPQSIVTKQGNSWDPSAVSAMANMTTVYNFYSSAIGWTPSGEVRVVVLPRISGAAVSYNPGGSLYSLAFGEDTEAALDVVGHEYTHSFIASVHGRSFGGAFGDALDEAYGDVIGNLIEGKNDEGRWLFAEDAAGAPFRSLKDPSNPPSSIFEPMQSQPDSMSGFDENEGGHYNSTIFGHAAYRMMTSPQTVGISNVTWAQIFAGSIRRLPSNPTFQQARNAVIASASVLGLTASQQAAIAQAFADVGISSSPQVKIVLTWGATPSDLDSHLTGPAGGGSRFHVYFADRVYFGAYDNQNCGPSGEGVQSNCRLAVDLDYDDTTSYGPESTTIRNLVAGDYYFYVHNYSNRSSTSSTALATSGAVVTVYKPDSASVYGYAQGTPIVFQANNASAGTLWTVFKLTIPPGNGPGNVGQPVITPLNTYSYQSEPSSVGR